MWSRRLLPKIRMDVSKVSQSLQTGYGILVDAFSSRQVPKLDAVPEDVLQTCTVTCLLGLLVLLCLVPGIRRFIFQSVESVLAILLLLALILIVLGMPVGELIHALLWDTSQYFPVWRALNAALGA